MAPKQSDGRARLRYTREVLIPEIAPGTVVILDNLAIHSNKRAAQALRAHRCRFYLPPYSPDPNPIEMAAAKLNVLLRRIGAGSLTDSHRPSLRYLRSQRVLEPLQAAA
ncbi:transposase [Paracoccus aminovorans]|uniref:transposase n=1 Tax=Paracoccus aminovorans TaxID=34004 RepID=UPI003CC7A8AB